MDFKYTKSGSIFNLHPYWTKQPLEPIIFFIDKYSKENEIILDPFGGTGTVGVASILRNRNAIINDISPICCHISEGYTTKYNVDKNAEVINEFKERLAKKIADLYKTSCTCGKTANVSFFIISQRLSSKEISAENIQELLFKSIKDDLEFKIPKDAVFTGFDLIRICYKCSCSNTKIYKIPDEKDIELFNSSLHKNLFYPTDDLFGQEPKRNFKKGIKKVFQLYSSRNLSALSIIFNEISTVEDLKMRKLFLFAFTSILFNCSLLSRYRSYENTSIKMGTFYIPPLIKDNNVLESYLSKLNLIIKANKEIFINKNKSNIKITDDNADNLKSISDNSIDFIYTDPPYTDVISYSELNIVWESWLKKKTNVNDELIVSKFQEKDITYFTNRFKIFLDECYRVLKPRKFLVLVFHHPNIEHWGNIQEAIISSKLYLLPSEEPTRIISNSKTSSQHKTNKHSQCFLAFTFCKELNKENEIVELKNEDYQDLIRKYIDEAESLGYSSISDKYDYILNKLLPFYKIMDFSI